MKKKSFFLFISAIIGCKKDVQRPAQQTSATQQQTSKIEFVTHCDHDSLYFNSSVGNGIYNYCDSLTQHFIYHIARQNRWQTVNPVPHNFGDIYSIQVYIDDTLKLTTTLSNAFYY